VWLSTVTKPVYLIMSSDVQLHCPHCGTDKENFEKNYIAGESEVYEYTMCSVCGNLVASSTIHDVLLKGIEYKENTCNQTLDASCGCNHRDQDGSVDQSEHIVDRSDVGCEIGLIDNGRATCNESLPLSLNNNQTVKNSCSAYSFEEKKNSAVAISSLVTLDNGDLSRDSLKKARELHFQSLSCTNCTGPGSHIVPVEGVKDIFHCSSCFSVHGVDDSMNYYDLLQKGDYMVEACIDCGNNDPYFFLLEYGSDPDSISLKCMKCSHIAEQSESKSTGDTGEKNTLDQCMKELIHYECKCNNSNSELQEIFIDSSSNTVFVKCWICQREDMIALPFNFFKAKICPCNNSESFDVKFDEYGYVSRLVCEWCQAEMDCGVSSAVDVPAAGDGTSTGRTRITSFSDIQIGDHIAWHQFLGYWHHAIVTEVNGGQIRVIHYNGPSVPNKGT